jgi:hypothetical protein
VLDRVAVLAASPVATFLALLLQLLLSLGIRESKVQLDAIMLALHGVKLADDMLGDVTSLEPGSVSSL